MADKHGLLIALGLGKKPDKSAEQDAKEQAIQDMFDAAKDENWANAADAFKRAYEACAGDDSSDGTDEGD